MYGVGIRRINLVIVGIGWVQLGGGKFCFVELSWVNYSDIKLRLHMCCSDWGWNLKFNKCLRLASANN